MEQPHDLPEDRLRAMCSEFKALNQEAFEWGSYEVAYHALAAAFQCCKQLDDAQGLVEIQQTAEEQLAWINTNDPDHKHSTPSAFKIGRFSVFDFLVRQAKIEFQIIQFRASRKDNT
jgi:hypothetical protein